MINARTKYMSSLVAEAFDVQEYEASVSTNTTAATSALLRPPWHPLILVLQDWACWVPGPRLCDLKFNNG